MKTIYFLIAGLLSLVMAGGSAAADEAATVNAKKNEVNISGAGGAKSIFRGQGGLLRSEIRVSISKAPMEQSI